MSPSERAFETSFPAGVLGRPRAAIALLGAMGGLAVVMLTGCGAGSSGSAASDMASAPTASASSDMATTDAASGATIHISSFRFMAPATVSPGATVSVMNMDSEAHTVTADAGKAFDVKASPGKIVTFTAPTEPGKYKFHCAYHSNMHGVLVVQ